MIEAKLMPLPMISIHTDNGGYRMFDQFITKSDTDGMISQALLVGNFEAAVDICIEADRMVRGFYVTKN